MSREKGRAPSEFLSQLKWGSECSQISLESKGIECGAVSMKKVSAHIGGKQTAIVISSQTPTTLKRTIFLVNPAEGLKPGLKCIIVGMREAFSSHTFCAFDLVTNSPYLGTRRRDFPSTGNYY
jgi:hypothetical protein